MTPSAPHQPALTRPGAVDPTWSRAGAEPIINKGLFPQNRNKSGDRIAGPRFARSEQRRAQRRPRSRSRLATAICPICSVAPAVDEEQCEPMTRLSSVYQAGSAGGSCSKTSRPAP